MPRVIHLRSAHLSLVLDARGDGVPVVVHWGADLGDLADAQLVAAADASLPSVSPEPNAQGVRLTLVPMAHDGWAGRPALTGSGPGGTVTPQLRLVSVDAPTGDAASSAAGSAVTVALRDETVGLDVTVTLTLDASGVLQVRSSIVNNGSESFALDGLAVPLPLPARAREVLDFTGRWGHEREPQRRTIAHGTWLRETRHGRTGHDSPYLAIVGTPGFTFRHGEVWASHLAWSGDQAVAVESQPTGHAFVSAGELLAPGEVVLQPGERYDAPATLATYSPDGIDGVSRSFHAWVRSHRPARSTERSVDGPNGSTGHSGLPVILNTWEAVYFEHDEARLLALAEAAASAGVERFVLDDGWMKGRIDDTRALGDWVVDPVRWPRGLHPLTDRVRELGMEFGLWVEPEMISLDSDVARAHPEWVLTDAAGRPPVALRNQFVIDLSQSGAYAHVLDQLCALLDEYPIAYFKWDHNRDLVVGSSHRQTLAAYRLMDEVRERFPEVEIESCSSGGARVDLGVLERTDRVWASDTNDPIERQAIQRWSSVLVPPELLGSHVGAPVAHLTGRTADLSFRLATALFAWAGIEWDISRIGADDLEAVRRWIGWYTQVRHLVSSGTVVRTDSADDAMWVHGVVAADGSEALVCAAAVAATREEVPEPIRVEGLVPDADYAIEQIDLGPVRYIRGYVPPWLAAPPVLSGRVLAQVGLAAPVLAPGNAVVLRLTKVATPAR